MVELTMMIFLRKLPRISNKQSSSDVSSYMDSDDKVLIKQLNFVTVMVTRRVFT